jgi:hypothetical protein
MATIRGSRNVGSGSANTFAHPSSIKSSKNKNGIFAVARSRRPCLVLGSNRSLSIGLVVLLWSLVCLVRVQQTRYIDHITETTLAVSVVTKDGIGRDGNNTVVELTLQWLKDNFPSPYLALVFADRNFLDFTINSYIGFEQHSPETQYLMVGMDTEIVSECRNRGISSLLFTDILGAEPKSSSEETELVRMRCARMDVVSQLQRWGYHVFLFDSDIAVASGFHMSYFAGLDADFVSGRGTFPRAAFSRNKFALQSGFYIAKSTPIGIEFFANATALCRDHGDGQRALNQIIMENLKVQKKPPPEADHLGTKIYNAYSAWSDNDPVEEQPWMKIGILGERFFPTGCEFLKLANHSETIVKHPFCMNGKGKILERRVQLKKASLAEQGGWYFGRLEYNLTELLAMKPPKTKKTRNEEEESEEE